GRRDVREVVDEGGVDDAIRCSRSALQAVKILESPPMNLGPSGGKRLGRCLRTCEAEHSMPRADQLLDDGGTDETRGAGDEDTHVFSLAAKPRLVEIMGVGQ